MILYNVFSLFIGLFIIFIYAKFPLILEDLEKKGFTDRPYIKNAVFWIEIEAMAFFLLILFSIGFSIISHFIKPNNLSKLTYQKKR